ncbi:YitT family protein [Clostridium sp.]|uniref:YitT family protein n=1 Tax=Clostridium sp. TaxID=1506 RepID=UPI002FC62F39
MKSVFENEEIKKYLLIIIGVTILAMGINVFYSPYQLVTGGVSGFAIIVEYVSKNSIGFEIPLWLTNLVVNIPLFIIGIRIKGRSFAGKALFAAGFLSIALWYTSYIPAVESDLLIASVFGGALVGLGVGLVLRASASTGGTDLLATIIKHYFKTLQISNIMLGIDSVIITIGLFVFGVEKAMYALISVFIISKVINSVLEGINYSKAVHIISTKSEEVSNALMKELKRGVTGLNGTGMYTGGDKKILFVVCSKNQIVALQKIVTIIDDKAFITITDVREVVGRGFTEPQFDEGK